MTSFTPIYEIPYPDATDTPCSVCQTLADAADVIGAAIASLEETVRRMYDPPAFRVEMSAPATVVSNDPVPFTTVVFDREGVADLAKDEFSVPFSNDMRGLYFQGGDIQTVGSGTPGAEMVVNFDFGLSYQSGRDSGTLAATGTASIVSSNILPDYMTMNVASSALTTITVNQASAYVLRLSAVA